MGGTGTIGFSAAMKTGELTIRLAIIILRIHILL
jgi:hypothetical protein